ncbi:P-loop containing nucleoside triphosphate hydrolase protein [Sparassis latifolia]
MHRYLSLKRSSTVVPVPEVSAEKEDAAASPSTSHDDNDDTDSTAALVAPAAALPPPNLKVKRVDYYYSTWGKTWKYRNSGAKVTAEMMRPMGSDNSDPWQAYCFVVVRKMPSPQESDAGAEPKFQVTVKSPYFLKACRDVMQEVQGISWTADPLELDPHLLIAFLPQFEAYQHRLQTRKDPSTEDRHILATVGVLLEYLYRDYRSTILRVQNLTSHGEITFDLLYAVFTPRTVLVTECPITGEPRALQLKSVTRVNTISSAFYDLVCESIDAADEGVENTPDGWSPPMDPELHKAAAGKAFGRVQNRVFLPLFKGTVKINSLDAFPINYHPAEAELRRTLLTRGRKWMSLRGVHHMHYKGTSAMACAVGSMKKLVRFNVNSRVMVDRGNFKRLNPNYELPVTKTEAPIQNDVEYDRYGNPVNNNRGIPALRVQSKTQPKQEELTEDEIILTSPVVYGFSLSDKIWLEFNVEHILPIVWNDEAFANLVLPADRKTLLQSLVEAHNADLGFDDFVQGKGHGLVINLFGPPGVGKTLSAEATSEHVRRPLYVIGCGDLGTKASELDQALERVFDIATSWKAIVLIDEADVFLEQRSLHDLERNAMVAVFLRHVEYYRGILFMTTNRIKTFDEAFLSRIHVALHFQELSQAAKVQVWRAFLQKVGASVDDFDESVLQKLAEREINGRQIKNATRTANSLAVSRGEKITFRHLTETLDAMQEFAADFAALSRT